MSETSDTNAAIGCGVIGFFGAAGIAAMFFIFFGIDSTTTATLDVLEQLPWRREVAVQRAVIDRKSTWEFPSDRFPLPASGAVRLRVLEGGREAST